jgi:CheY-like chemotaxis protein
LAAKSVKDRLLLVPPAADASTVFLLPMEAHPSASEWYTWQATPKWGQFAYEAEGGSNPDWEGRRDRSVAIVEDEEDLLSVYSTYLKSQGYDTVYVFANGEDFVKAVLEGKVSPDLVIMDYRLPGKDGIEVGKEVTELKPDIRVLVTTADDKVKRSASMLGFQFLLKPFTLRALVKALDGL